MNKRDLVSGLLPIAIGAAYLSMALGIRPSALDDSVGPAGMPIYLAWIMIGLGVVVLIQAFLARRKVRPAGDAPDLDDADAEETRSIDLRGVIKAGGLLAIAVIYMLMLRPIGYVPSVFVLIVAAALYGGAELGWRVFVIGAVGAVFYWLIFVVTLGIPLPSGMLGTLFG